MFMQRDFENRISCIAVTSARAKSRIVLISNELDMSCQAEDCEFWGPTLDSVDFWGTGLCSSLHTVLYIVVGID